MCLQALGLMWPALTLPFTICHIPHYRESIGMAPVLISPSYTPTAISPLQQSLSDSLPPAYPTFIYCIYIKSIYSILHLSRTMFFWACFFWFFFFFCSVIFFLFPCSQNIVSHLNCLPSVPQCPIYSMFNSFSASSNSVSLGFDSMSSSCTRLVLGTECILSPIVLIAASWLALHGTANLLVWI